MSLPPFTEEKQTQSRQREGVLAWWGAVRVPTWTLTRSHSELGPMGASSRVLFQVWVSSGAKCQREPQRPRRPLQFPLAQPERWALRGGGSPDLG